MITTDVVKQLRDATGVSVMQCKKALEESGGDMEKATMLLAKKSADIATKKGDRTLGAGIVSSYVHATGTVGTMLELLCETDFVAQNEEFKKLARDIAMHVAANNPLFLDRSSVDQSALNREREVLKQQALESGKPVAVVDKMVEGRLSKYYQENCLLEQEFVKDPNLSVGAYVNKIAKTSSGEAKVLGFWYFKRGEGLEKKDNNFAQEVAAMTAKK